MFPTAIRRPSTLVIASVAVACAFPASAAATFKVFPTRVDLEQAPGKASVGTFNVGLKGEGGRRFEVVVSDAQPQPDGSFAFMPPTGSPFSASSWLSASPQTFTGVPNRTQPVQYRVAVPQKAQPGDYVSSLLVERLPKKRSATTTPIEATAVRVEVRVSGKARPAAEIASLSVPKLSGESPVDVTASIRNTGNVTLDFDRVNPGSIEITAGSDAKADLALTGSLYPDQTREFQLSWDDPPLFGRFEAAASVDVGKEAPRSSQSFLVVPWRQIGALVLITLAAVVLLAGARRRAHA